MHVMTPMAEDGHFDAARKLRFQVDPGTVLIPGRMELALIEAIKMGNEGEGQAAKVDIRPTSEFSLERSLTRLRMLPGGEGFVDAGQSIRCIGALLIHLRGIIDVRIDQIVAFSLDGCMDVGVDALMALQVFGGDTHPNMHSSRQKEGFSLFGLLNKTKSDGGARLLRSWLMRPLMDITALEARLDAVQFFVNNLSLVKDLQEPCPRSSTSNPSSPGCMSHHPPRTFRTCSDSRTVQSESGKP